MTVCAQTLLHEYALSSKEGVTLLSLAEALLRVRSAEGRSRLIQDKLDAAGAEWSKGLGLSKPALVNAASTALAAGEFVVGSKSFMQAAAGTSLGALVHRIGSDAVRVAVVALMRKLGEEFVLGETIEAAMQRADHHTLEVSESRDQTVLYSFDMLGEAARTARDADEYFEHYASAIKAIGTRCAHPHGNLAQPSGVSVKLSALDPRFEPSRRAELVAADSSQLVARVVELATMAAAHGLDFTIDAEEASRLELQLDVVAKVSRTLAQSMPDWEGLGLAVQAYQRRATAVIDWIAEVARRDGRKQLRVRLVKGAYWDYEIKLAQLLGLPSFPVFTRKEATDVCYAACVGKLLAEHRDCVRPAFATHNARTVATVAHVARQTGNSNFELQRLHGMGLDLHAAAHATLFASNKIATRIYAPVGKHDKLLAYLVRRLLENGSNSSFVHALADDSIPAVSLAADPVSVLERRFAWSPHAAIRQPLDLFGQGARKNSQGIELCVDFSGLEAFAVDANHGTDNHATFSGDVVVVDPTTGGRVGYARQSTAADIDEALRSASQSFARWDGLGPSVRAAILRAAGDIYESRREALCALLVAEAGKTWFDALGEVREAVDFLRYYADQAEIQLAPCVLPGVVGERNELSYRGRGIFAAISPWNFPLAIFTGQLAAALAAGNTVIAKSAPQTPLIAEACVAALYDAGIPCDVLHHLPDPLNKVGPLLVQDTRVGGIIFTGSGETATAINRELALRPGPITPLVAETAGLNALIADESALPEQLVTDVIRSAFVSTGQRCSNTRLLCVPTQTANDVLSMLAGAVTEVRVGDPADLSVDCGPLIDPAAKQAVQHHVDTLLHRPGVHILAQAPPKPQHLPDACFFSPIVLQLPTLSFLPTKECFGPVLHILTYDARADDALSNLIHQVNSFGYALTAGLHSRLDTAHDVMARHNAAGNLYINRDTVAAVVESQPFGGTRLSGTGPKAGGPNYVRRFAVEQVVSINTAANGGDIDLMSRV